jgi:hypothetical protein
MRAEGPQHVKIIEVHQIRLQQPSHRVERSGLRDAVRRGRIFPADCDEEAVG